MYPRYHACLAARRLEKFGEVDPPGPKVIGAHMLNVGRIFEFIIVKKLLGGPPSPVSVG